MELSEFEKAVLKTVRTMQERGINSEDTERLFKSLSGREDESSKETAIIKKDVMTEEKALEIPSSQGTVFVTPDYAKWISMTQPVPQPVEPLATAKEPVRTPQVDSLGIMK